MDGKLKRKIEQAKANFDTVVKYMPYNAGFMRHYYDFLECYEVMQLQLTKVNVDTPSNPEILEAAKRSCSATASVSEEIWKPKGFVEGAKFVVDWQLNQINSRNEGK